MQHRFVIGQNDLPRRTAIVSHSSEAFEDVEVDFGPVRPDQTYVVTMTSQSERSLDQAAGIFRRFATQQRALRSDNRV
jgi:hypothetical protein